ncbi:MAG TPA: ferredoxin [Pseudonocardia sp.]|jgi:3-phenylpropionate/trans-cinnamate dioxygenase ferredoxin reductase subunit|uniref:ferredoxin n=1 Tax=Pseudonocardia sp. TaxID=60912 RepID=UPI002B4B2E9A|nr:ferredoxin [Pseudonocardia sp.]HLU56118.1 ferredoxin [Pseudonocardia sp.]
MPVLRADLELCQGYANCVVAADDVFDIDDGGVVVLLRKEIDEADLDRVRDAVRACPVSALSIEGASSGDPSVDGGAR